MTTPNKIGKYLKETISSFFKEDSVEFERIDGFSDKSSSWSDKDETVVVKRAELESLQSELFEQTQIAKKLKTRDLENKSLISEYEASLISLGVNDKHGVVLSREKMENEIERLKSNESRLKSHVQALKRDLISAEQNIKIKENSQNANADKLKNSYEDLQNALKRKDSQIQELLFANEELKFSLKKRCEELIELGEICKELLKEFV